MPDTPVAVADAPAPSIVNTPEPTPEPTPAAILFPTTPNGDPTPKPDVVQPPAVKPGEPAVTTPPPVISDPKPPAEPDVKPAQPAATPAPTDYTLSLPENSPLSVDDLASIAKEAKAANLSKEQADKVVQMQNQYAVNATVRAKAQQEKAMSDAKVLWRKEIESDPEIGGDKLKETTVLSSRAYKAVVSQADRQFIEQLGLDHTPAFTRIMAKIGRLMAEDKVILGNPGGSQRTKTAAEILYPNTPGADGKRPSA